MICMLKQSLLWYLVTWFHLVLIIIVDNDSRHVPYFPGYKVALLDSNFCSYFLSVTYTVKVSFDSAHLQVSH